MPHEIQWHTTRPVIQAEAVEFGQRAIEAFRDNPELASYGTLEEDSYCAIRTITGMAIVFKIRGVFTLIE